MTESPRDKTGRKPDGRFPTGDKRPDASPTQTTRIADARKHIADRPKRIEVAIRMDGKVALTHAPHRDDAGWQQHLLDAFGTTSQDFASTGLNLVTEAQRCASETEASVSRVNAALAAIDGTQPADEMSAMLASQMVVTHALAMDFLGRAKRAETIERLEAFGNLATKLSRTFTSQIEALGKLKRGGEQVVRVEHVHVHSGGQAIVGAISHRPLGAGGSFEMGVQPDGAIDARAFAFAPGAAMPGEEPSRIAVPKSGRQGQEKVSHARRR